MSTTPIVEAKRLRTVRDVAEEGGVAPSAVRFYEQHGVITAVRTSGNQRRFDASAGCQVKVAKLAQRVGFTVREIAEIFQELPGNPQPQDWARISDQLIASAERRLEELTRAVDAMRTGGRLCELNEALAAE
ncbi:MerR family redox-sensitive transcriptional activator SoxR [Arthrobacter woluwensis]|uniref:MerR family DNA-binding transcriptional regulator n=1 Tax=Arthrobacter woluwensis TaxID=156980 RepID=UPI0027874655|nr:MerR family DNA-binding transcriptional regulator [Arthrobacter woluwensis]MDQ0708613.1 MerR family redox-sensitive transcriptional activator SoxR [Arthrobacter woluwensis]